MSKICKKCGQTNAEWAADCGRCGESLKEHDTPAMQRKRDLETALGDIMCETEPFQYGATINVSHDVATLRRIREIARRALAHEPPMQCSPRSDTAR